MLPFATPETTRSCSIRTRAALASSGSPHRRVLRADDLELAVLVDSEVRPAIAAVLVAREPQRSREHRRLDPLELLQLVDELLAGELRPRAAERLDDHLGSGVGPGHEGAGGDAGIPGLELVSDRRHLR